MSSSQDIHIHSPGQESDRDSTSGSDNGANSETQQRRSLIHSHDEPKGAVVRPDRHPLTIENLGNLTCEPRPIEGIERRKEERSYTEIPLSPIGIDGDETGTTNGHNQFVTLTGTIKRGQKPGQLVELRLNQDEARKLKRASEAPNDKSDGCMCGLRKGLHVVLFTILCFPVALIASLGFSFYVGTLCWYNIYLYLSEERSIWHKVFLCPLLILSYPFLIVLSVVGVSIYAAFIQVSWFFSSWLKEFRDFEKGFYGWVCRKLGVSHCAPFEVVILNEDTTDDTGTEMQIDSAV